jgi:hypothetical protein
VQVAKKIDTVKTINRLVFTCKLFNKLWSSWEPPWKTITPNYFYRPVIQIFATKILSNSKTILNWIALLLIVILPQGKLIGGVAKIADIGWIWEVFKFLISPGS